ncbi:uncharacterized protein LACBIDRAFT_318927 [Laccaria bicolor S238N-H82]|uniref:Predicted protein n=1 Tax=Laccaria bicolor (strain S238N-H82 / ATCC MYA-4686) TaxID=486041 RepID=B0D7G2_LACBS|nr:uncharacterized protein LACBIDRAFT_318927 [Laccaria bicolor S238N-H82]EDR09391.1 predicted protein [Laccaria bicolor S238N-H82]|eukprot:XP_001879740.1 predicted protein [Laccaria bicolor S238N-H82]
MSTNPSGSEIKPLPPVLDVEESRAKRLQRQQARFRARGGIFVPSNRNLLADILLGRAAPRQSPRRSRSRSLSCSPSKPNGGNTVLDERGQHVHLSSNAIRRSPRKAKAGVTERPVSAGPSREKPISALKKSSASKGKRKAPDPDISEDAPVKKARGRPSKKAVPPEEEEDEDAKQAAKTTSRKGRKPTATKLPASQKRSKAKAVARPEVAECDGEPPEEVKPKRKSQKPATTKPTAAQKKGKAKALEETEAVECGEVDAEPHEELTSKSRARKSSKLVVTSLKDATVADSDAKRKPAVKTSNDLPKRTRSKKPKGVYVEVSEDDDDLSEPSPKRSSKSTSRSKQSALASKGEPSAQATKPKSVGKTLTDSKRARPKKPAEASVALSEEDDDDLPQLPPKRSSKSAPRPQRSALTSDGKKPLSVIEEEEEEEEGSPVDKNAKRDGGMAASVRPRKRTFNETTSMQEDTLDADDHPLRKRCKTVAPSKPASQIKEDINTSSDPNNAPISHKQAKAVRGKPRPRKAPAGAEEVDKAPKSDSSATKRKKTVVQELGGRPSKKSKVETTSTDKSFASEALESEAMANTNGRQTKTKRTKTSKKENTRGVPKASEDSKVYTKVAPHKGPPQSVLLRIQKIAPRKHDDDNEPDPIDFLS